MIYVAALSDYNRSVFSERKTNRLWESVELFENLIKLKYLRHSEIILLLNREDIFRKNLREDNIPLSTCFGFNPNYNSQWKYPHEQWTLPHFQDDSNFTKAQNDENFEEYCTKAIQFIENIFLQRNHTNPRKPITTHIINATVQKDVKRVLLIAEDLATRDRFFPFNVYCPENSKTRVGGVI